MSGRGDVGVGSWRGVESGVGSSILTSSSFRPPSLDDELALPPARPSPLKEDEDFDIPSISLILLLFLSFGDLSPPGPPDEEDDAVDVVPSLFVLGVELRIKEGNLDEDVGEPNTGGEDRRGDEGALDLLRFCVVEEEEAVVGTA